MSETKLDLTCTGRGYMTIPVLPFLNGRYLDSDAIGMLYALRPSSVRVTTGMTNDDSRLWRVTVYMTGAPENRIVRVEQEVEFGITKADFLNGKNGSRMAAIMGLR